MYRRNHVKQHPTDLFANSGNSKGVGAYWLAKREHALMLRCEGFSYRKITARFSDSDFPERGKQLTLQGASDLAWAMRHTKFRFE